VVEWRADSYRDLAAESLLEALRALRNVLRTEPIIFTLRIKAEGGAQEMTQEFRSACIDGVIASKLADFVDVELCNGREFLQPLLRAAAGQGVHVILSYHDFEKTPANELLLAKIQGMNDCGAGVAKIAVMPRDAGDVLRLLEVTLRARQTYPRLPLCTMSMGKLGVLTRTAGFLYGSDMAYAVGQESSAPGQIPIHEARAIAGGLLKHA
jgi:3-dehydroquinate dehydratase-1